MLLFESVVPNRLRGITEVEKSRFDDGLSLICFNEGVLIGYCCFGNHT